jgi:hypothetical protein
LPVPVAFTGPGTPVDFLDIGFVLGAHPAWQGSRWLPCAGDGTGNHFVVDAGRAHLATDGVFFVDVMENPLELAYVVASDLSSFLVFLLEREIGVVGWPFDREFVLGRDRSVGSVAPQDLLPWHPAG